MDIGVEEKYSIHQNVYFIFTISSRYSLTVDEFCDQNTYTKIPRRMNLTFEKALKNAEWKQMYSTMVTMTNSCIVSTRIRLPQYACKN
jgi:hypothetical protein